MGITPCPCASTAQESHTGGLSPATQGACHQPRRGPVTSHAGGLSPATQGACHQPRRGPVTSHAGGLSPATQGACHQPHRGPVTTHPPTSLQGYKHRNAYITTQGPLETTVQDFWRMIWEFKSKVIVMLCQTQEDGKVRVGGGVVSSL